MLDECAVSTSPANSISDQGLHQGDLQEINWEAQEVNHSDEGPLTKLIGEIKKIYPDSELVLASYFFQIWIPRCSQPRWDM